MAVSRRGRGCGGLGAAKPLPPAASPRRRPGPDSGPKPPSNERPKGKAETPRPPQAALLSMPVASFVATGTALRAAIRSLAGRPNRYATPCRATGQGSDPDKRFGKGEGEREGERENRFSKRFPSPPRNILLFQLMCSRPRNIVFEAITRRIYAPSANPKKRRALSPHCRQRASGETPRASAMWRTVKTVKAGSLRLPRQGSGER